MNTEVKPVTTKVTDQFKKEELHAFGLKILEMGNKELIQEKQVLANDFQLVSGLISVLSQYMCAYTGGQITKDFLDQCKTLVDEATKQSMN